MRPGSADARTLTVRFYEDAWNRADETAARAILDASVRFKGSLQDEVAGRKAVLTYMRNMRRIMPDFRCIIDDLVSTPTRAAARLTFTGTHQGTLLGYPATGRTLTWPGSGFFTAANNRLVDIWVVGDTAELYRQLTQ